jgi:uncharacterized protein (DUF1778 family)
MDRIEATLPAQTADAIGRAAALTGKSASEFIVDAAADRAEWILRRHRPSVPSDEAFERLLKALDESAQGNPELIEAVAEARDVVKGL